MASRVHQPMENEEFDFILARADGPVLAYFWGIWSEACKEMDPIVRELAGAYGDRLTTVKTDITRCPAATKRYGVTGAPTFLLLVQGEVTATGTGPMTREQLTAFLDAHL
ncbi:thioredoxin [Streptomyces sp. SID13666]|uniref:thioredoxin family protein n=1 Tax=Streptomyces TaxID=1883 RepID=UPI0011057C36|nr:MULTISPECIES: thioredoxin domain-containing protein [Streptomyces]MCZ4100007.1 thioredoxin domain-containing protein [Streptomyces sp. H39-C1]NEA53649.1 thioredoxin [Streptomyces sp. SID13666]NEA71427.1 thioredoxin [Streptomyces sp. SID13588]QNA76998.1 thioredoxin [Streptomyces sp. So13.3]